MRYKKIPVSISKSLMIKGALSISVDQKTMGPPTAAILPDSFPAEPPLAHL